MKTYKNYPNGYQPKIDYYSYRLNESIQNLNEKEIEYFSRKVQYFVKRQNENKSSL